MAISMMTFIKISFLDRNMTATIFGISKCIKSGRMESPTINRVKFIGEFNYFLSLVAFLRFVVLSFVRLLPVCLIV